MRIVWPLYVAHRDEIARSILETVTAMPDFASIAAELQASTDSAATARATALQEGALLRGEWGPYLQDVVRQGRDYATRGVPFDVWHVAVWALRNAFDPILLRELGDRPDVLATAQIGKRRWIDLAMQQLVNGYLAQRDELARDALETLAGHVRDLERSNQELDRFAYVASHDLKAPLRDVDNLARWIVEDLEGQVPEDTERHLSLLRDRVGRMQRLVDDLLQYSRAGRNTLEPEEVDLATLVWQASELSGIPASFRLEVREPMPLLHTPRAPLAQVLRNLLSNAVKHHERSDGVITVSAEADGDRVRIAVSDDGPGIPPELQEKIFVLFTTLEPRDVTRGRGMGLAIVKKLVETSGGTIEVDSEEGRGATFTFTWPSVWTPDSEPFR